MLHAHDLVFARSPKFAPGFFRLVVKFIYFIVILMAVTPIEATNLASQVLKIANSGPSTIQSRRLGFHTVAKGFRSGVRTPLQAVVRNQNEWEALWRRHTSIDVTPPPLPAIDFDKFTVLGLFLGEKPTGGYDVEIVRAEPGNTDLVILYRERSPTGNGVAIQSLTQPFHIVEVTGPVNFQVFFRRAL